MESDQARSIPERSQSFGPESQPDPILIDLVDSETPGGSGGPTPQFMGACCNCRRLLRSTDQWTGVHSNCSECQVKSVFMTCQECLGDRTPGRVFNYNCNCSCQRAVSAARKCMECSRILLSPFSGLRGASSRATCSRCQREIVIPFCVKCRAGPRLASVPFVCGVCQRGPPISSASSGTTSASIRAFPTPSASVRTPVVISTSARTSTTTRTSSAQSPAPSLSPIEVYYQNYVQALHTAQDHYQRFMTLLLSPPPVVHLMIDRGHWDLIPMVADLDQLNAPNLTGQAPIQRAIWARRIEIVRHLCQRGVDLTGWDHNGGTALHYAAESGDLDLFKMMTAGTDLDHPNLFGATVGHMAARHRDCIILRYLDSIGFNLGRADGLSRRTPIMIAAMSGNLPGVQFLCECGYLSDTLDIYGSSLGFLAAYHSKNLELVSYLHQRGIAFICQGFKIHPLIVAWNLEADLEMWPNFVESLDPKTDPLEGYGCSRCEHPNSNSPRWHLYMPGRCMSLLERILTPLRTSTVALQKKYIAALLSRGIGYTYPFSHHRCLNTDGEEVKSLLLTSPEAPHSHRCLNTDANGNLKDNRSADSSS